MAQVAYTVVATLPSEGVAREYVEWLLDGHVAAVVAAGAVSGVVVRSEEPPLEVETRYVFPGRAAFERYVKEFAPGLRAEGARRFPVEVGIRFERRVGVIEG
jgi:hypothetical protein